MTVAASRFARFGVVLGVAAGLFVWLAQDLGEVLTGQATDPNSGLLLIVIAVAFWPTAVPAAGQRPDHDRPLVAPQPAEPRSG